MSIIVKSDGDKRVTNISQRDSIGRKFDGMQVTVDDASDDPTLGGGRALYQWSSQTNGWDLVWAELYGASRFATEYASVDSRLTALENAPSDSSVIAVSAMLEVNQTNNTTTPQTLNNHIFTIPPQKTLELTGRIITSSSSTSAGTYYGVLVQQGDGANGSAIGSWYAFIDISANATATALSDGDGIEVGANGSYSGGVLGTASNGATPLGGFISLGIKNTSTNVDTTVSLQFRSEVNNSTITARFGTSASGILI